MPRSPTPWMLRKATANTMVRPIVSNARSGLESRATKFDAMMSAAAASHGASELTATRWRRASPAAAATNPAVQRRALRPQGTARGGMLGGADGGQERPRQPVATPDQLESHVVPREPGRLGAEVAGEEAHQRGDFGRRSLPVVGGEGVQRERGDAEPGCGLDR